jgi:hypothetical protein
MLSLFSNYSRIERPILLVILAEFFIQLVNATFMNLQPLYMKTMGFQDDVIADYISWCFLGVLVLALPLGLFIKGRKVKTFFYLSAFGVPFFALLIIVAIHFQQHYFLITAALYAFGIFTYYLLIKAYIRRENAGLIEKEN